MSRVQRERVYSAHPHDRTPKVADNLYVAHPGLRSSKPRSNQGCATRDTHNSQCLHTASCELIKIILRRFCFILVTAQEPARQCRTG